MITRSLAGMIVIADKFLFYIEMVKQFARDTGILTGYRSDATQRRDGAKGYVSQIANRRCDNVKSRGKRRVHNRLMDRDEESVK